MVAKKPDYLKAKVRTLTVTPRQDRIIKEELGQFGEFSGFVHYCIEQPELIKKFKKE